MVRTSPVRENYPSLINTVLKRRAEKDDPVGPNDAFFLFDSSKKQALTSILAPFAKKEKVVKPFLLYKEEDSMMSRYQRVRGVGTIELGEGLHILTREPLTIPLKKFLEYHGSTAGDMIGPIVMPRELLPPQLGSSPARSTACQLYALWPQTDCEASWT